MALSTTATFDSSNTVFTKRPVYIVEFSGTQYSGSDVFFTTGDFSGITTNYKKLLLHTSSVKLADARPIENRNYLGDFSFQIEIDEDNGIILDVIKNYEMTNRKVIVKYGYEELAISDFTTLPAAYVREVQFDTQIVTFYCQLAFFETFKQITLDLHEKTIARTFIYGETFLQINDADTYNSQIGGTTYDYDKQGYQPFLQLDNKEIFSYSALSTGENLFGRNISGTHFSLAGHTLNAPLGFGSVTGAQISLFGEEQFRQTMAIQNYGDYNVYQGSKTTGAGYHAFEGNHGVFFVNVAPPGRTSTLERQFTMKVYRNPGTLNQSAWTLLAQSTATFTPVNTLSKNVAFKNSWPSYRFTEGDVFLWQAESFTPATPTLDHPVLKMTEIREYDSNLVYDSNTIAKQVILLKNKTPGEGILRILTGMPDGSGSGGNYDPGIIGFGAGISLERINSDQIIKECAKVYGRNHSYFKESFQFWIKQENAFPDFMFDTYGNALRPMFFYHDEDGKIALSLPDVLFQNTTGNIGASFTDSNIIGIPATNAKNDEIVNQIKITKKNELSELGDEVYTISNNSSINLTGATLLKEYTQRSNFTTGMLFASDLAKHYYRRLLHLYGNPSIDYEIEAFYSKAVYQVPDDVMISHSKLPNLDSGSTRGVSQKRGFIWGSEFEMSKHPKFTIRGFESWMNRYDPNTSLVDYNQTTLINDTSLSLSATNNADTLPSDAYVLNGAGILSEYSWYKIKVTSPGSSPDQIEYIKISAGGANTVGGANYKDFHEWFLPYNPARTLAQTFALISHSSLSGFFPTPTYWKVDWIECSSSTLPTVEFVGFKTIKSTVTLTTDSIAQKHP